MLHSRLQTCLLTAFCTERFLPFKLIFFCKKEKNVETQIQYWLKGLFTFVPRQKLDIFKIELHDKCYFRGHIFTLYKSFINSDSPF